MSDILFSREERIPIAIEQDDKAQLTAGFTLLWNLGRAVAPAQERQILHLCTAREMEFLSPQSRMPERLRTPKEPVHHQHRVLGA